MATSPNFGWLEPDNTDLVKNGALAIRTAIDGVDASMADLQGGTTGQVLSKTSNTDMDFTWVAQDDANAIQNTQLTAKGALISAVSAGTPATLTVGANDSFLLADSSTATGLKWNKSWIGYTPVWTAATTNPTIGNGTIIGGYRRIGNQVDFWISMTAQSTTTFGSGNYRFSLPVAITSGEYNFGYDVAILDSGVTWYNGFYGTGIDNAFTDKFEILNPTMTTRVSPTFPMIWTVGDGIRVYGSYRVEA